MLGRVWDVARVGRDRDGTRACRGVLTAMRSSGVSVEAKRSLALKLRASKKVTRPHTQTLTPYAPKEICPLVSFSLTHSPSLSLSPSHYLAGPG